MSCVLRSWKRESERADNIKWIGSIHLRTRECDYSLYRVK